MEQQTKFHWVVTKGEKGERVYEFVIPDKAPYGEILDASLEMVAAAENLSKQVVENIKKAVEEAKKKAETMPVEAELV
ncbi:hypothetical protein M0R72_16285, partial [Candidatus Pacearchaeota archaeon]|jgi:hypothetical protein|nr:hypothetical protein [Candidatus Pacearchaeota archaeon]